MSQTLPAPIGLLEGLSPGTASPYAPFVPADAPFSEPQRQWLNGLFTGLTVVARAANGGGAAKEVEAAAVPLIVAYGSQSGTAEALSKNVRKFAATSGFKAEVKALNDLDLADLAGAGHALLLCSTFGEGEPPDNAMKFFDKLMADDAPSLEGLSFSVLGLGDSSYAEFNKSGRDLDARMEALGASRAAEAVLCDVAYEEDFDVWKQSVFASEPFASAGVGTSQAPVDHGDEPVERYTKNTPFPATLLEVRGLSGAGSKKEVNHVEISLAGSGLDYAVGDALGVWPVNCSEHVAELLAAGGFSGREVVTLKDGPLPLRAALLSKLDVCVVTPKTLEVLNIEAEMAEVEGMHVVDLLETFQPGAAAQQLAEALRPLQPRLYSISSSPRAHPGEVHLTVGAVRYETHSRARKGVASTFLSDRCGCGAQVGVYLQRSAHFHIPAPDVPLILCGPGTGIAPFRAFLEERAATEAPGENWLFFGDQTEADDFLYREELEAYSAKRRARPARPGLVARRCREGLRAAPDGAGRGRAVRLVRTRGGLLHLRRRVADGQGRGRVAAPLDRGARRPGRSRRGGVHRDAQGGAPLSAGCLLSGRRRGRGSDEGKEGKRGRASK